MDKTLFDFITKQLIGNLSEEEKFNRTKLFLNYLNAICENSLTGQDFKLVRKRLSKIANNDYLDSESLDQALHIEPFLRELYCLKNGVNDRDSEGLPKVMISFGAFPDRYLMPDKTTWTFKTSPKDKNNNRYFKKYFSPDTIGYIFASAYAARNIESHTLTAFSLRERAELFTDIINVFVTSTWFTKGLVQQYIVSININLIKYFEELKSFYKKRKDYNSYIPPKGKVRRQGSKSTDEEEQDIFDFYESCSSAKRLRIIGKAGMGKTTAIKELIKYDIEHFNEKHCIPVFVELISVTDVSRDIESYIAEELKINEGEVKKLLESGKLIIYFDGLNEITLENNAQKALLYKINQFFERYERSFMVLSNRENNHIEILNGEPTYYVLPLNDDQIEDFINKNFPKEIKENKKLIVELKRQLDNYEEIRECARTPYMLKRLIEIAALSQEGLPQKSNEITKYLLEAIITRELKEKREPLAEYAEDFLKGLSIVMPEDGNIGLSEKQVRKNMLLTIQENVLPIKPEKIADVLRILIEMNILKRKEDQISFSNQDYKNYYFFAACS